MHFNGLSKILMIALQCGVMMLGVSWSETFSSVAHAQESSRISTSVQYKKISSSPKKNRNLSISPINCYVEQKTDCQSQALFVEQVKLEKIFTASPFSSFLVKTSFSHPPDKKEFLTPEIYVDRKHRNFQEEIIEIFNQTLILQGWQDGAPILLECHCDAREPLAYSLILGHRWGKSVETYLKTLAVDRSQIEFMNYGNKYDVCDTNWGECQQGSRLQATFNFLAIREPNFGCLIRLQLPSQRNYREKILEKHPLFLQEIHVAGVWEKQRR